MYYLYVVKESRGYGYRFCYTDKDEAAIKERISNIEMKPANMNSHDDNRLVSIFKESNTVDRYMMDSNYIDMIRYLYEGNIQIHYDVDPNIKKEKPINIEKVDQFIDDYKTIINSNTLDTKLFEINAFYEKFKKLLFCIRVSKPIYYISTLSNKTIDITKYPSLLKSINMFSQNNIVRDDSSFIKHGNPKLQQLEIIRYYKSSLNSIKELLCANGIELVDDSMDELNYTEQFIEAIIERLYMRIIHD